MATVPKITLLLRTATLVAPTASAGDEDGIARFVGLLLDKVRYVNITSRVKFIGLREK